MLEKNSVEKLQFVIEQLRKKKRKKKRRENWELGKPMVSICRPPFHAAAHRASTGE